MEQMIEKSVGYSKISDKHVEEQDTSEENGEVVKIVTPTGPNLGLRLTALTSVVTTVVLSLLVAWQGKKHQSYCLSMAHAARLQQSSTSLDPSLLSIPPNRPVSDEAILKSQRLTHLVIPFHVSQEEQAKRMLEMWKYFPPCKATVDGESDLEEDRGLTDEERAWMRDKTSYFRRNFGDDINPLGRNIELVFFVSSGYNMALEESLLGAFNALPEHAKSCFSSAHVRYASLKSHQDTYLDGSREMFEKMLQGTIGITEAKYAMYMEPDCRPIRPYWLSVIDSLCRYPNQSFWVKGTIFRGNFKAIRNPIFYNLFHINGNAIYNVADQGFRDYYFNQVRPYVLSLRQPQAYDTDTFKYLIEPAHYDKVKDIIHKFQFSDFIQNHWHADYSMAEVRKGSDITVLVHGGNPKP